MDIKNKIAEYYPYVNQYLVIPYHEKVCLHESTKLKQRAESMDMITQKSVE